MSSVTNFVCASTHPAYHDPSTVLVLRSRYTVGLAAARWCACRGSIAMPCKEARKHY